MAGLAPTRAAVRALDGAHGINSEATEIDEAIRTAIDNEWATNAEAAAALNLSETAIERYLDGAPFKGDVMAVELMWASYVETNP